MSKKFLALLMAITLVVLSFAGCSKSKAEDVKPVEDFRVVAYVRGDYVQEDGTVHSEDFDIITHVILFECASFDADGQVVLETEKLETALKNIRTAIGERDVKISLNLLGPAIHPILTCGKNKWSHKVSIITVPSKAVCWRKIL